MTEVPRTFEIIQQGLARGLHAAAQLYVSRHGKVLVDRAFGEASPDSLLLWLSASKPVAAVAVAQLWESERLHLDDKVADFIPGFERHGKGAITLRHLLTHTPGLRHVELPLTDWDACITALVDAPLADGAVPGKLARYSAHANWFLLGEIVQRAGGETFRDYARRHIFEPLGMDHCSIGLPPAAQERHRDRLVLPRETGDRTPGLHPYSAPDMLAAVIPGANGLGPARQLARLYEALLNGGELPGRSGSQILEPETVDLFTAVHREDLFDHSFQYPMVWGLGFIRENPARRGRMPYGYGRHASPQTFGHSGMESAVAFADPAHDLAVALLFSGLPGEREHQRRVDGVLTTLYEELGLAK